MTTSGGPALVTFSYDATNQSYTVSDGTRSRTFLASNIDPTQSSATLTTYKVTSGNTTDFLSITKPGTAAGQTRYVAAGFWQRQVNGTTATDGLFTAFSYGIITPDGTLPRTGMASFDVKLLGAKTFSTQISSLSGTGAINVDFKSGGLFTRGSFSETNNSTLVTAGPYGWQGSALLSSTTNRFDGSLTLDNFGTGKFFGSFFGPGGEEVGATFSTNPTSDIVTAGAIFGARGTTALNQNASLATSSQSAAFYSPISAAVKGTLSSTGILSGIATAAPAVSVYLPQFASELTVYNADGRISDIPSEKFGTTLQYMRSIVRIDRRTTLGFLDTFVYGFDTPAAGVPRTGTGSFDVQLAGGVAAAGSAYQTLRGTGSLSADFATGAITTIGGYSIFAIVPGTGVFASGATETGTWAGSAALASAANLFNGTFNMTGATNYSGTLSGKFFGPSAEEVGAAIQVTAANGNQAIGTLFGARGASIAPSQTPLANLTSTTLLQGSDGQYYVSGGGTNSGPFLDDNVDVTYDPVARSYIFKSTTTDRNFGFADQIDLAVNSADLVASASDAKFAVYHGANYDARIFKSGAANPQIALTYTSFADITRTTSRINSQTDSNHFIAFGGQTPNFQMPRTGTASYSGVVYGRGSDGSFARDALLSGTSKLDTNFGTGLYSMVLSLISTDKSSGASRTMGDFTYAGTAGSNCPGSCPTNAFLLTATGANLFNSFMNGKFFGPSAAEFGANFQLNIGVPGGGPSENSSFAGITVGKKGP